MQHVQKYVPLVVILLTLCVILFIPLGIMGTGYLPCDDVLAAAANAVSGQHWDDVVLLRPDVSLTLHSPGWDTILRATHLITGANQGVMVGLAIAALMTVFLASGLPGIRRPEAWLCALVVGLIILPDTLVRISLGRPFVVSAVVLISILTLWTGEDSSVRPRWRYVLSIVLLSLAAWIHGSWYLFALPVGVLFLTGNIRRSIALGLCCAAGVILGGCYTGHPVAFIEHHVRHVFMVLGSLPRPLQVHELQPYQSTLHVLPVILAGLGWLGWKNRTWRILRDPVFVLTVLGLLMGTMIARFWLDWGLPAMLLWLARIADDAFQKMDRTAASRIPLTLGLGIVLVLGCTRDVNQRWTKSARSLCEPEPAGLAESGALPTGNGIVYSASMHAFDMLRYRYPHAKWRYVAGSEIAIMPTADLPIYIRIQQEGYRKATVQPWVDRMTPDDRLVIFVQGHPALPDLAWSYIGSGLWSGRRMTSADR